MSKTCQYKECNNPVFSKGFCKYHQRKTGFSPKFPIRKVSKKQQYILEEKRELSQKDRELWMEIWNERNHRDFETGEPIYGEALTLYFHHVLPKRPKEQGGYPEFRYKKWNIILVSWETHTKAENNIDLVPKIKAYKAQILKQHEYELLRKR